MSWYRLASVAFLRFCFSFALVFFSFGVSGPSSLSLRWPGSFFSLCQYFCDSPLLSCCSLVSPSQHPTTLPLPPFSPSFQSVLPFLQGNTIPPFSVSLPFSSCFPLNCSSFFSTELEKFPQRNSDLLSSNRTPRLVLCLLFTFQHYLSSFPTPRPHSAMSNKQESYLWYAFKDIVSGGVGGIGLVAVGHPFDTIKVRTSSSAPPQRP